MIFLDVTPAFPTSLWAVLGSLLLGYGVLGRYFWKDRQQTREDHKAEIALIREDLQKERQDNQALRDKFMDKVIPALETTATTMNSSNAVIQRALEVVAVANSRNQGSG